MHLAHPQHAAAARPFELGQLNKATKSVQCAVLGGMHACFCGTCMEHGCDWDGITGSHQARKEWDMTATVTHPCRHGLL